MGLEQINRDRTEEIKQAAAEIIRDRLVKNINEINAYYEKHYAEIDKDFCDKLDALYEETAQLQNQGIKGKISFITISYLFSGVLTKNYQVEIALYDENAYMDKVDTNVYWNPTYITKYFEEDMKYMVGILKNKIVQLQDSEIQKLALTYIGEYYRIIGKFMVDNCEMFHEVENFDKLQTAEKLSVSYGGYLENGLEIYEFTVNDSTIESEFQTII